MSHDVSVAVNVAVRKLDLQTFVTANMHLCSCRFTSALILLRLQKQETVLPRQISFFPSFFLFCVVVVVEALLPSEEQTPSPLLHQSLKLDFRMALVKSVSGKKVNLVNTTTWHEGTQKLTQFLFIMQR